MIAHALLMYRPEHQQGDRHGDGLLPEDPHPTSGLTTSSLLDEYLGVLWHVDLEVVGAGRNDLPHLLVGGPQVGMVSAQVLPYLFGQGGVVFRLQVGTAMAQ